MQERKRPPYATLRDDDQLHVTITRKVPIKETLANLRMRPIEVLVLESTSIFRLTVSPPTGIAFYLHRHDDVDNFGLVDTKNHDIYSSLRLERTKGTSFRIWLNDDAGVEDLETLVNYPIVLTRGGFGVIWVNAPRAWNIVRNEIDGRAPALHVNQYNQELDTLNTWSSLSFPEAGSKFELDAFRSKAQFGYEKCGQLIKKYGDTELSRKLRIMQSDFMDKVNQAKEQLRRLKNTNAGPNADEKTIYRYERTLRNIIKLDTDKDGKLGPSAQEAFCSLYGYKTSYIDRDDATHLFNPFDTTAHDASRGN